jgi:hypothetical protein
MIRLDQNPSLSNSIKRARSFRDRKPRVRYIDARTVEVTSPRSHEPYIVTFTTRHYSTDTRLYGACTCDAGRFNNPCWHLIVASGFLAGLAKAHGEIRRRYANAA